MSGRLGCAQSYQVAVHRRGGTARHMDIPRFRSLKWGRRRNEISEGQVIVPKTAISRDCCRLLGQVGTWRHELSLYRDGALQWQGPIWAVEEDKTTVTIDARDVLAWLDRSDNQQPMEFVAGLAGAALPRAVIQWLVQDAFSGGNDPNILAYVQVKAGTGSPPLIERDALAHSLNTWNEIQELIKLDVNVFAVGRVIYIADRDWDTYRSVFVTPDHFMDDLVVREAGSEVATAATVTGDLSVPIIGTAGGLDPVYGRITQFSTSDNSDQETVDGIAAAQVAAGLPAPVVLRVPDGSQLNQSFPLRMHELIPGRLMTVGVRNYCRPLQAAFALERLDVDFSAAGEKVSIAVSTAA